MDIRIYHVHPGLIFCGVNLDVTHGLKKLRLFGCLFRTHNTEGRAVRILNPANINANGLFSTNIERNEFSGGLFVEASGFGSVRIKDGYKHLLVDGSRPCNVTVLRQHGVSGTSLSIKDNYITSLGGAISILRTRRSWGYDY